MKHMRTRPTALAAGRIVGPTAMTAGVTAGPVSGEVYDDVADLVHFLGPSCFPASGSGAKPGPAVVPSADAKPLSATIGGAA